MSIISDALKKAERERVLKEKIEEERARLSEVLEAAKRYDQLISEKLDRLETEGRRSLGTEEKTENREARPFSIAFPDRRSRSGLWAFLAAFAFFTVVGLIIFAMMNWPRQGREPFPPVLKPEFETQTGGLKASAEAVPSSQNVPTALKVEPTLLSGDSSDSSGGGEKEVFKSEPVLSKVESVEAASNLEFSKALEQARIAGEKSIAPSTKSASAFRQTSRTSGALVESAALENSSAASRSRGKPYVLSGITKMGKDRFALINDQILRPGDWVNGATVKAILDNEVILETTFGELKLKISR